MTQEGFQATVPADDLALSLDASDRNRFRPGEALAGRVRWRLAEPPEAAEVRLFWFTTGQGARDVVAVQALALDGPLAPIEDRPFRLRLPAGPYTFAGTLTAIQWAVELVLLPGERSTRIQFDLSPFDAPIVLAPIPEEAERLARARDLRNGVMRDVTPPPGRS